MPSFWPSIPENIQEFIKTQPVFFVASAPLTGSHINISPKGHPSRTFAILNQNQVAYVDTGGSGAETISHIYENGRVTLMWCSFVKTPRIVRLFCTGRVIERNSPEFRPMLLKMRDAGMKIEKPEQKMHDLIEKIENGEDFSDEDEEVYGDQAGSKKKKMPTDIDLSKDDGPGIMGSRAIIVLDVFKAQKSCGFGVPLLMMDDEGALKEGKDQHGGTEVDLAVQFANGPHDNADATKAGPKSRSQDVNHPVSVQFDDAWDDRTTLTVWSSKMVKLGALQDYRVKNNTQSLDGLPGLKMVRRGPIHAATLHFNAWIRRIFLGQWQAVFVGFLLALLVQVFLVYGYIVVKSGGPVAFSTEQGRGIILNALASLTKAEV